MQQDDHNDAANEVAAAGVTVDKSLNQTFVFSPFPFLSNEYLCTILVLLSYSLILGLLTRVT